MMMVDVLDHRGIVCTRSILCIDAENVWMEMEEMNNDDKSVESQRRGNTGGDSMMDKTGTRLEFSE